MIELLFLIMIWAIRVVPWIIMASWIVGMADPDGRWAATRVLNTISLPFLRVTSGMIPRIGQLDISPLVIVLLAYVVGFLLRALYF